MMFCRGLYCANRPKAIFLSFLGRRKCILTENQSTTQGDKINLTMSKWFSHPVTEVVTVSNIF